MARKVRRSLSDVKPVCPTHHEVLVYEADADRWSCAKAGCSTIAIRRAEKKAFPPKVQRPKTLMEVFGEPSMPSTPRLMKPSNLGICIEDAPDKHGKVARTVTLFDALLNIEIDVTDYTETILDEHRSKVTLVMNMNNVVRR